MTRTVFEGKPLLQEDRAQVLEEESKERFFGRLAVLSLGVRIPPLTIALPTGWEYESMHLTYLGGHNFGGGPFPETKSIDGGAQQEVHEPVIGECAWCVSLCAAMTGVLECRLC